MGLGLAVLLVRWGRRVRQLPDSKVLAQGAARLQRYEVMARLVSEEDKAFFARCASFNPLIAQYVKRKRRRILRLYLRELRGDFMEFWSLCFLLTPYAKDAEFGVTLLRQWFTFHGYYARLWLWSFNARWARVPSEVKQIAAAVQQLGQTAHRLLQTSQHLASQQSLS
jgi:hypothetical protein